MGVCVLLYLVLELKVDISLLHLINIASFYLTIYNFWYYKFEH